MRKKRLIIIVLLLIISLGFASISAALSITGESEVKANTWDVHFENVRSRGGSTPQISANRLSVNYNVTLVMPGDYYEFIVDAKNDGTIDAMIDTISNTGLTEQQQKYIDYSVKFNNGDPVNEGYILKSGRKESYVVRLEYKKDLTASDLPTTDQTLSLTFTVNYVQADNTALERSPHYLYSFAIEEWANIGANEPAGFDIYGTQEGLNKHLDEMGFCLKHKIEDGLIKENSIVFRLNNTQYEVSSTYYEAYTRQSLIKTFNSAFGESNCSEEAQNVYYCEIENRDLWGRIDQNNSVSIGIRRIFSAYVNSSGNAEIDDIS